MAARDSGVGAVDGLALPTPGLGSHPRLVELVAAELRRLIVSGQWPQGHRLVESRVAEQLGVSRNPVREAIRSLEAEGFVEVLPRRGARVAVLDAAEVAQLLEVRSALEELAAALAARRRSEAQVVALNDLVAKGRAVAANGDVAELPALNTRFHLLLAEASGNPQLDALIRPLRDRIQWVYATRVQTRGQASWDEHAAIAAAVADGDEARARELAGAHIASATRAFLDAAAP
jgi:DNA-binding GntR family transcriptional regulator